MTLLNKVNWSDLLQPSSIIPSDITFSVVVEQFTDTSTSSPSMDPSKVTTFTAHKYYLAAVSPVFAAQFFGSLPEVNSEIVLTDVTARAFKCLLDCVYGQNVDLLDKSNARELFEAFHVADKYMIEDMKKLIQDRFDKFKVTDDNVVEVTKTALEFKHFGKESESILKHVSMFRIPKSLIGEVFDIAVKFKSEDLMETVLKCCRTYTKKRAEFFWCCFKIGFTTVNEPTLSEKIRVKAQTVVDACISEFQSEDFKQIILETDLASEDSKEAYTQLTELFKQSHCDNCKHSPCMDGKLLGWKSASPGCKVKENSGLKRIGTVLAGKFQYNFDLDVDEDDESFTDFQQYIDIQKIELADGTKCFDEDSQFIFNCK